MSESKLVDGKTGELIGNYYTSGNYVNTTTSNYVPASTYAYGSSSGAGNAAQTVAYSTQPASQTVYTTNYQPGYSVNGGNYAVSGGNYAVSGAVGGSRTQVAGGQQIVSGQQVVGGQVVGTTVNTGKEVIKGESRIEYVPFEKKIVEYKDQAKVERVPKKVKKVEYREERKIETIPKEVTVTDYYAVEYLRQYIPQYVPEKRIEYVQVPKKQVRYEYIPVERYLKVYSDKLCTIPTSPLKWKEEFQAHRSLAKSFREDILPKLGKSFREDILPKLGKLFKEVIPPKVVKPFREDILPKVDTFQAKVELDTATLFKLGRPTLPVSLVMSQVGRVTRLFSLLRSSILQTLSTLLAPSRPLTNT
jgi:hypothetical protein